MVHSQDLLWNDKPELQAWRNEEQIKVDEGFLPFSF